MWHRCVKSFATQQRCNIRGVYSQRFVPGNRPWSSSRDHACLLPSEWCQLSIRRTSTVASRLESALLSLSVARENRRRASSRSVNYTLARCCGTSGRVMSQESQANFRDLRIPSAFRRGSCLAAEAAATQRATLRRGRERSGCRKSSRSWWDTVDTPSRALAQSSSCVLELEARTAS